MDYCGVSLGYRTVVYDCGWEVFKQYALNETTEFSGKEAFCDVMRQINPEYTEEYDDDDIEIIEMENYSDYCVEILEEHNGERCAALCYAFTCWVKETVEFPYIRRHDLLYRLYNIFLRKFLNRKTIKKIFIYDNRN
jgi:hypothetical protein